MGSAGDIFYATLEARARPGPGRKMFTHEKHPGVEAWARARPAKSSGPQPRCNLAGMQLEAETIPNATNLRRKPLAAIGCRNATRVKSSCDGAARGYAVSVERLVIGVFVDQDHRQQARPSKAACDRVERCRRLCDRLAGSAAELRSSSVNSVRSTRSLTCWAIGASTPQPSM